jgi:hypothetical protein
LFDLDSTQIPLYRATIFRNVAKIIPSRGQMEIVVHAVTVVNL